MAKSVSITGGQGGLDITVDDHKITEVLSYKLEGTHGRNTLTLVTEITEAVTTTIEAPK